MDAWAEENSYILYSEHTDLPNDWGLQKYGNYIGKSFGSWV